MFNGVILFSRVLGGAEILPPQTLNSFGFDGTDTEYLEAASSASLDTVVAGFGWVYLDSSDSGTQILISRAVGNDEQFEVRVLSGSFQILLNINGTDRILNFSTSTMLDTWSSFGFTYDQVSFKMFINGIQEREEFYTGAIDIGVVRDLTLSTSETSAGLTGSLTTIMLFDTAPTGAEMLDLHQAGKSVYISTLPSPIKDKIVSAYALSGQDDSGLDLIGSNHLTKNGGVSADGELQSFSSYIATDLDFVPTTYIDGGSGTWLRADYDSSFDNNVAMFGRCYTPTGPGGSGNDLIFAQFGNIVAERAFRIEQDYSTGLISAELTLTNGTRYLTTVVAPLDAWFSWAIVLDGTTIRLYLNGSEVDTIAVPALGLFVATNEPLLVGTYSYAVPSNWIGNVTNFTVFDTIPTPAEIATLDNGGDAFKVSSLAGSLTDKMISCWEFSVNNPLNDLIGSSDMTNDSGAAEDPAQPNGEYITFS